MPAPLTQLELFHRIVDDGSAKVRLFIADNDISENIRFRNIEDARALADFQARGGTVVPALWDGSRLIEGTNAVEARLRAFVDVGRAEA